MCKSVNGNCPRGEIGYTQEGGEGEGRIGKTEEKRAGEWKGREKGRKRVQGLNQFPRGPTVRRKYLPLYRTNLSCSSRYHISYFHPSEKLPEISNGVTEAILFGCMLAG